MFKIERGTNSGIVFLLPTICIDIQKTKLNLCIAFLWMQLTINWEVGEQDANTTN